MDSINFVDIFFRVFGTFVGSSIVWFFIFRKISKLENDKDDFKRLVSNSNLDLRKAVGDLYKKVEQNTNDIERINNPVTIAMGEIHQRMNGIDDRINNLDKK